MDRKKDPTITTKYLCFHSKEDRFQPILLYSTCLKQWDKLDRDQYYKTILGIIYATIGVFPYDFDWGYANSDIITPKKVL